METMKTTVSSGTFISNFKKLRSRMTDPLPSDVILFQCENCQTNLPLNSDGVLPVDEPLEQELAIVIDEMLKSLIDTHIKQSDKCASSKMHIHPVLGTPKNICVSFPVSDTRYIRDFQLAGDCYKVNCQVTQVNSDYKAIFVLYQNENHSENTYSEFINCNFDNFLNTELPETEDCSEQELIYDDESVSCYQQKLPRMIGGGRKLKADYNYVCLWCPKEDLKKGIRGRYKELKNYRDHFKKYHHGEDGKGVPMSDFLKKLNRCEPTWFCKKCKQHYSLGNHVRHKAICQPEKTLDSSESDDEETQLQKK